MPADTTLDLLPAEASEPPAARRDTPQEQPDRQIEIPAAAPEKASLSPSRRFMRGALFALRPLPLIGGAYWYVTGGQVMSTHDAYVNAETVGIATDVSGIVQQINVTENQHVDNGPRPFQIALDNARANLAQTALTIASMKQDYGRMLSDVTAQQAQVALDQASTYDRNASLVGSDAVSKATYDQARFTLEAAQPPAG